MRESESCETAVSLRKIRQQLHDIQKLLPEQAERLSHDNEIRVVPHIAGGRPEVKDTPCGGTLKAIGIDMAHDIMPDLPLPPLRVLIIDVIPVGAELCDLLLCDRKAELLLRLRQRDPKTPPAPEFVLRREKILHPLRGIAPRERSLIAASRKHPVPSPSCGLPIRKQTKHPSCCRAPAPFPRSKEPR